MKRIGIVTVLITGALLLAGSGVQAKDQSVNPQPIKISMINKDGKSAGFATLKETPLGVGVHLHVTGLKPGKHGIHFHETGVCTPPDFKTAGGHFNPGHTEHGLKNTKGPHAGDLKNVIANKKGEINTVFSTNLVTLKKGMKNSLLDQDGSALVIHEGADDQMSNPSGN